MAENNTGRLLLEKKDFVAVVDDDGNDLPYQVPKHWGSDQLAAGVKKKSSGAAKKTAKKTASKTTSSRSSGGSSAASSSTGGAGDSGDGGTSTGS